MVGSSSTSRFERRANSRASSSRERSPPDSDADLRVDQPRLEQEFLEIALDVLLGAAHVDPVAAVGEHVADALVGIEQLPLLVDHHPRSASCARVTLPSSGSISPVSSLSRVVLPAPLAPTTPIRSPRWMRSEKSRMIARSPKRLVTLLGLDHHLGAARRHFRARASPSPARPEHRRARRAHVVQLGEPPLVAPAPGGDAALQPVQLELQLGVELLGRARLLGIDLLGPGLEAAIADLGAPRLPRSSQSDERVSRFRKVRSWLIDDEGAGIAAEPILQPFDRGEIEMVGRLVEQQHVAGPAPAPARSRRGAARRRTRCRPAGRDRSRAGRRSRRPRAPPARPGPKGRSRAGSRSRPLADPARAARPWSPAGSSAGPRPSRSDPARHLSRVVLPAPLRPISASRSRAPTNRSRPRNSQPEPWTRPRFS